MRGSPATERGARSEGAEKLGGGRDATDGLVSVTWYETRLDRSNQSLIFGWCTKSAKQKSLDQRHNLVVPKSFGIREAARSFRCLLVRQLYEHTTRKPTREGIRHNPPD